MAKREALKDLQNRLAERFESARNSPISVAWLAILVDSRHYLLPLKQSGEIFPLATITHVPYAAAWFAGVVNLRGGLYGVVDLAGFMAGHLVHVRSEQSWSETSLITFNPELDINCALLVDGLAGLRRADAFSGMQPAPPGVPSYLGPCYLDAQGLQWQELDMHLLSQSPDFLNIGA
ncbi:MAG: chemotaxis protein CheW [Rhodoferax sp.]|jgi:twitching motility protein PilI|nr:chemotaxis protein CheW [Rhodoferax sp.]